MTPSRFPGMGSLLWDHSLQLSDQASVHTQTFKKKKKTMSLESPETELFLKLLVLYCQWWTIAPIVWFSQGLDAWYITIIYYPFSPTPTMTEQTFYTRCTWCWWNSKTNKISYLPSRSSRLLTLQTSKGKIIMQYDWSQDKGENKEHLPWVLSPGVGQTLGRRSREDKRGVRQPQQDWRAFLKYSGNWRHLVWCKLNTKELIRGHEKEPLGCAKKLGLFPNAMGTY